MVLFHTLSIRLPRRLALLLRLVICDEVLRVGRSQRRGSERGATVRRAPNATRGVKAAHASGVLAEREEDERTRVEAKAREDVYCSLLTLKHLASPLPLPLPG